MLRPLAIVGTLALAPLSAQIGLGEAGLLLVSNNVSTGTLCPRVHPCTYIGGPLFRGMNAEFLTRGVLNRPWAVALWFDQPHQCIAIPGFHNELMAPVVVLAFSGTMTEQDGIRACPGGVGRANVTVPGSLLLGSALTFQALVWSYYQGNETPTFTSAIRAVVQ